MVPTTASFLWVQSPKGLLCREETQESQASFFGTAAYKGPSEETKPHSEESYHHLSSQLFPKNKFSNEILSKKKKKQTKHLRHSIWIQKKTDTLMREFLIVKSLSHYNCYIYGKKKIHLPIQELGRSPEGGNGNPCQYSCLKDAMDRGAWQATT